MPIQSGVIPVVPVLLSKESHSSLVDGASQGISVT